MTVIRRPRKPQALPLMTDFVWVDSRYEEQDTYNFWFRKAQELNPESYRDLSDDDGIPTSILASLYPEVIALGPCAPTIIKAFNTLKAVDRYLARQSVKAAARERKSIEEYINICNNTKAFSRQNSLVNFLSHIEPGNLHRRFDVNFTRLKTDKLIHNYGHTRIYLLGVATAGAIHLVHSGATREKEPAQGIKFAISVVKAFQKLEAFLLQENIITPEHLTNITLPGAKAETTT